MQRWHTSQVEPSHFPTNQLGRVHPDGQRTGQPIDLRPTFLVGAILVGARPGWQRRRGLLR